MGRNFRDHGDFHRGFYDRDEFHRAFRDDRDHGFPHRHNGGPRAREHSARERHLRFRNEGGFMDEDRHHPRRRQARHVRFRDTPEYLGKEFITRDENFRAKDRRARLPPRRQENVPRREEEGRSPRRHGKKAGRKRHKRAENTNAMKRYIADKIDLDIVRELDGAFVNELHGSYVFVRRLWNGKDREHEERIRKGALREERQRRHEEQAQAERLAGKAQESFFAKKDAERRKKRKRLSHCVRHANGDHRHRHRHHHGEDSDKAIWKGIERRAKHVRFGGRW